LKRLAIGAAVLTILAALAASALLVSRPPSSAPAPLPVASHAAPSRLLVLYQHDARGGGTQFTALLTANLLGRFGHVRLGDLDAFQAADAQSADAIFVAPAFGGPRPPQALLDLVRSGRIPVVWMQHGAKWLAETPAEAKRLGWRPGPPAPRAYLQVRYKGQAFLRDPRDQGAIAEVEALDPARARVLAAAVRTDGRETPWAVRSGTLTYVVEAPYAYAVEDDRYLVFADLLFRILAPGAPARHRAMVRIEDVGPEADPARVRRIAEILQEEGVPFSIAVYDSYRDPRGHFHKGQPLAFDLREKPALVRTLKAAQRRGAYLVAHGHTHQFSDQPNPYAGVSGGDYEFFRAALAPDSSFRLLGPLPDDRPQHWRARLADLRQVWRGAGLTQPQVFTTPHYAASLNAYAAMRESFPVRYERVFYFQGEGTGDAPDQTRGYDQYFPFETVDARGDFIVPENMGFGAPRRRPGDFGRSPEELIATARRNLVVQDGFASFFYHWYEDPERLRQIVRGLKALGYTFVTPIDVVAAAPAWMSQGRQLTLPEAGPWERIQARLGL
jgi:uncharacterized protein YdaL